MKSSRIFHLIIALYVIFTVWYIFNDPDCQQMQFDIQWVWLNIQDAIELIKGVFHA